MNLVKEIKMKDLKKVISEFDSYENNNYRIGAMAQVIIRLRQKLESIDEKIRINQFIASNEFKEIK